MMRDWKKDIRDSFIILVEIIIICFLIVASNNHYEKSTRSRNQRLPGLCSAPCKYDRPRRSHYNDLDSYNQEMYNQYYDIQSQGRF